jgi:hypothetical protein
MPGCPCTHRSHQCRVSAKDQHRGGDILSSMVERTVKPLNQINRQKLSDGVRGCMKLNRFVPSTFVSSCDEPLLLHVQKKQFCLVKC